MKAINSSLLKKLPSTRLINEFSIWSADLLNIGKDLKRIHKYADILHIDVADGHFSPNFLLFPDLVSAIRKATTTPIHIHLMATDSIILYQIKQFVELKVDLISIHLENKKIIDKALDLINKKKIAAGLVLKINTPVKGIKKYLKKINYITLLGTNIGVKGQNLDNRAKDRLTEAKLIIKKCNLKKRIILSADGGIRKNTVSILKKSGAEAIVLGSLAFSTKNLFYQMKWINSL